MTPGELTLPPEPVGPVTPTYGYRRTTATLRKRAEKTRLALTYPTHHAVTYGTTRATQAAPTVKTRRKPVEPTAAQKDRARRAKHGPPALVIEA